jgi:hypothetical protein
MQTTKQTVQIVTVMGISDLDELFVSLLKHFVQMDWTMMEMIKLIVMIATVQAKTSVLQNAVMEYMTAIRKTVTMETPRTKTDVVANVTEKHQNAESVSSYEKEEAPHD